MGSWIRTAYIVVGCCQHFRLK